MSQDYEALEAALDAEIEAALNPKSDTDAPANADTATDNGTDSATTAGATTTDATTISAEPGTQSVTSESDQTPPEQHEEMVAKERYDNAVRRMTQATQEAADLRRQIAQLQQDIQQLQQAREAAPPEPAIEEGDDDLKSALEVYPDIVGPLVKRNQMLEAKLAKLEASLGTVQQYSQKAIEREQQSAKDAHYNAIYSAFPDADALVQDPKFGEWLDEAPPIMAQALRAGTAKDVIYVLNAYTGANAQPAPTTNKLAAAQSAATPSVRRAPTQPTSQKPQFTRQQIAQMSMDEFLKNEAAIDEAMAAGAIN